LIGSFDTEVGSSEASSINDGSAKDNWHNGDKTPGVCASACAYAFLGGSERAINPGSRLGFHRFFSIVALSAPTAKLFSGQDLDATQRLTAALVLYVLKMGIDARLVVLASSAGPDEVNWITPDQARDLKVVFEPNGYQPWRVEAYGIGAIAISESNDGQRSIIGACSKQFGPYAALIDKDPNVDYRWLEQCRAMGDIQEKQHPVFGTLVPPANVQLTHRKGGGAVMTFRLPDYSPPLTSSEFFTFNVGYPMACSSPAYHGFTENLAPAVRLALHNCF
jgi:hypothetical protein